MVVESTMIQIAEQPSIIVSDIVTNQMTFLVIRFICFIWSIISANRDPVVKMLGDRFATVEGDDNSIYRYHYNFLL